MLVCTISFPMLLGEMLPHLWALSVVRSIEATDGAAVTLQAPTVGPVSGVMPLLVTAVAPSPHAYLVYTSYAAATDDMLTCDGGADAFNNVFSTQGQLEPSIVVTTMWTSVRPHPPPVNRPGRPERRAQSPLLVSSYAKRMVKRMLLVE
jgi:hypothetical protein